MSSIKLVDVDTASVEELQKVPGIGQKVAQSIISYREINGSISCEALEGIPYLRSSDLMWAMLMFSKSEPLSITDMDVETDKAVEKDKRLEQASGPVIVTDTNMRLGVVEMMKAAIDSASLSGPPASHVK